MQCQNVNGIKCQLWAVCFIAAEQIHAKNMSEIAKIFVLLEFRSFAKVPPANKY